MCVCVCVLFLLCCVLLYIRALVCAAAAAVISDAMTALDRSLPASCIASMLQRLIYLLTLHRDDSLLNML